MIEIARQRTIRADSGRVWKIVSDARRLPDWYARAEKVEVLSGDGLGRLQRVSSQWRGQASEVDQVVTVFQPRSELEWRHMQERLDGRPAPVFSAETAVSIKLAPDGEGATRVTIASRQTPVDAEKEAMMRANSDFLGKQMEVSLERLEALVGDRR